MRVVSSGRPGPELAMGQTPGGAARPAAPAVASQPVPAQSRPTLSPAPNKPEASVPFTKVKIKDDKLIIGRNSELLQSDSPVVLEYLKQYLPQFESRGRTWQNLLTDGKIPKTDADIQRIFAECDRLTAEIRQKIENIRDTYEELDEMVNKLYGV